MILFKVLLPNSLITCVMAAFIAYLGFAQNNCLAARFSPELGKSIREVRPTDGKKLLALTFDLCEGANETSGFDRELIEYLETNSVRATFFAGGKWMRSHPEQTFSLLLNPRFELGNHGWSHSNFRRITLDAAKEEVLKTGEQFLKLRGELMRRLGDNQAAASLQPELRLFRFPYGACTAETLSLLAELGMPAIQWSIVSGDPAPGRSAGAMAADILNRAKPGSIIIFHANGKGHGTLQALKELVPKLRGRGFEFVTMSELLDSGDPVAVPDCYENRPGDNLRYDKPSDKKIRPRPGRKFRVAIDIGHSWKNAGALSARNRPEYGFNREVARCLLRELSRTARIEAFIINPDGEDITLQQRAELVNGSHSDLLISIHHDSVKADYLGEWTYRGIPAQFCDRFWGYSLFISKANPKVKACRSFALKLGHEMLNSGFIPSAAHLEMAEFEGHQPVDAKSGVFRYDGLVVLKDSKSPAVLIECGTIKNRAEEKFLLSSAYRQRMARAVRAAVEHFATDKT